MTVNPLEVATQQYWGTSLLLNQGIGPPITTSTAIHLLGAAAAILGPHRRIKWKLYSLQDAIIQGGIRGKKKKAPPPQNNVLQFARI